MTLDHAALDFGDEVTRGYSAKPRKIVARAHVPAATLEASATTDAVSVGVTRNDDEFVLSVTPRRDLPVGPFQATVKVALVTPNGERLFGASLPVGGEVQPVVRALPGKWLLGAAAVGQTVEGYVVLQAPPGCEFTVEGAKADSADTTVEASAVRAVGRTYRVTQRVAKAGDQSSFVRFTVRTATGEELVVPVEVMVHGEAAREGGS